MRFSTDTWGVTEALYKSDVVQARTHLLEERSRQIANMPLPFSFHGYCSVCRGIRLMEFRANFGVVDEPSGMFQIAYSETGACVHCQVSSRKRFAVEMLGEMPRQSRLYVTEHFTTMREHLGLQYPNLISSEYLGAHAPGTLVEQIRHEDLHDLSFETCSLDAILCLDVLEHVDNPDRCLREIVRVLKPGTRAVLTFPFFAHRHDTVRRSELVETEVAHLLPAEYHGNPLGGGSLVFSELSWDFVERASENTDARVEMVQYWSAYGLHLGGWRFALVIDKT